MTGLPSNPSPIRSAVVHAAAQRSVLLIDVQTAQPIVAPSDWLYPETTTEASQVEAAQRAYGLKI